MKEESKRTLTPKLRFPEFRNWPEWTRLHGNEWFALMDRRPAPAGLPILAITQEHGAIPREHIDYHVSVTEASLASYKEVQPADFIISLRSFQGGIEYSRFHGICSPAYLILKRKGDGSDDFFRHLFKSDRFIQQLTRNIEGLRDGKMISFKQFSEQLLFTPSPAEQQKIADCLTSLDQLIAIHGRKLETLRAHKKGLMQQLFPRHGETVPRLRFPQFRGAWKESTLGDLSESISSGKDKIEPAGGIDLYGSTGVIGKTSNGTYNGTFLLVARVGANAGLLTKARGSFGVTDNTLVITLKDRSCLDFIFYYLDFLGLNQLIFGSGQPLITGGQLKALPIFLPDEAERNRLAGCLSALDSLLASQTEKVAALETYKKGLVQQLFPSPDGLES